MKTICADLTAEQEVLDVILDGLDETRWMSIAQAFAGPPGPGRKARMFPKSKQ